jgi:RNA polymerase sigma factor (sigma-70 family)
VEAIQHSLSFGATTNREWSDISPCLPTSLKISPPKSGSRSQHQSRVSMAIQNLSKGGSTQLLATPQRTWLEKRHAVEQVSSLMKQTGLVMDLVKRLPQDYAEVIMLRVVANLDASEVAEIVGKTQGNVRVLTHRGLKQLNEMLTKGGDGR